jgi:hypothetical protein
VKKIYAIVDRDGVQIWPFRYGGVRGYEDAEEIARELRRTRPDAEVEEFTKKKEEDEWLEFSRPMGRSANSRARTRRGG